MKKATLRRQAWCGEYGLFGQLELPEGGHLRTLELLWDENRQGQSCIPPGPDEVATYTVERDRTGKFTYYRIPGVEGREAIEIHPGNVVSDIQGCILLGLRLGVISGRWGVLDSRKACEHLLEVMGDEDWELEVRWSWG